MEDKTKGRGWIYENPSKTHFFLWFLEVTSLDFGSSWGAFGVIFGSWGDLGGRLGVLGASWRRLGTFGSAWERLGASDHFWLCLGAGPGFETTGSSGGIYTFLGGTVNRQQRLVNT